MINNLCFENIKSICFSGDIHGEFETIVYKLNHYTSTVMIVCGDIGMGFYKDDYYFTLFKRLNYKLSKNNNQLLMFRGNHDNPDFFDGTFRRYKHIHLIPDYNVISVEDINILCIGGAVSIDRLNRLQYDKHSGRKSYWGKAEMPYYNEERLDEINRIFSNDIRIVATHSCPSFAYPTTKQEIEGWLKQDEKLSRDIDYERSTMDKIFYKLKEGQNNITDWYYGHFHQHKLETHHGINFRLCDCGEVNEFRGYRHI